MKKIIVLLGCLAILLVSGCSSKKHNDISKIDLSKIDKLMIVAHPDDETIWGGAHLIEDDYLVVCVTAGPRPIRVAEFEKVMSISDNPYLMLYYDDISTYPEVTYQNKEVYNTLLKIIQTKSWKEVVTHNPDGEYGHVQHIEISKLTTAAYEATHNNLDNLMYFNRYVKGTEMTQEYIDTMPKIQESSRLIKLSMIKEYVSQEFITNMHGQMYRFENWIAANDWK